MKLLGDDLHIPITFALTLELITEAEEDKIWPFCLIFRREGASLFANRLALKCSFKKQVSKYVEIKTTGDTPV